MQTALTRKSLLAFRKIKIASHVEKAIQRMETFLNVKYASLVKDSKFMKKMDRLMSVYHIHFIVNFY